MKFHDVACRHKKPTICEEANDKSDDDLVSQSKERSPLISLNSYQIIKTPCVNSTHQYGELEDHRSDDNKDKGTPAKNA